MSPKNEEREPILKVQMIVIQGNTHTTRRAKFSTCTVSLRKTVNTRPRVPEVHSEPCHTSKMEEFEYLYYSLQLAQHI